MSIINQDTQEKKALAKNIPNKSQRFLICFRKAGAAGFEPAGPVLETSRLPLTDAPIYFFISLCGVCFLHHLQNFFSSNFC